MKITELFENRLLTEARKKVDWDTSSKAQDAFKYAFDSMGGSWDNVTSEIAAEMKTAMKSLNRADSFYSGKNFTRQGTYGSVYDRAVLELKKKAISGGSVEFPTGKEPTVKSFVSHLALAFPGVRSSERSFFAKTWTIGSGGKYKDPEFGIQVFSKEDFDDMWEEIQKHGTIVHVKFPLTSAPAKVAKFGKYLVYPSTQIRGAFGDSPETEYFFYVQSSAIFKNDKINKVEITDQEAARLNDFAETKNAAALAGIKAILAHFKSKDDAEQAINKAKRIDPKVKDFLKDMVSKSAAFKE